MHLLPERVEFLESGVDLYVATRDASLVPEIVPGTGFRVVDADVGRCELLLPTATSRRTLANLEACPELAITFCRPVDHRTFQLKGTCTGTRPSGPEDRAFQERYRAGLVEQLWMVGVPRAVTRRIALAPSIVVALEVREAFQQTPGPGAGRPISDREPCR